MAEERKTHIQHIVHAWMILTLVCYLHPAFSFKYQQSRWRDEDLPIPCHLNTASVPGDLVVGDLEQAVIQSIATWNKAASIQIFAYVGRVELEDALDDDGFNVISLILKDWLEVTASLPANRSTVGTTCTWSIHDSIGIPPRHGFTKHDFLRAFDIALNAETYRWAVSGRPNRFDIQSVITHELGHVLSLGHPNDDPRPADAPTMVERTFPNATKLRTLEPDDIDGVRSIYRKVSGVLREDAHWENMILIGGDVIVPRGVSLTISHSSPQTIIHFSPASKLIVEGELTIDAARQQVLFTGIDGMQWGGLEIRSTAFVDQIAGCIFEGAEVALTLKSVVDVSVDRGEFRGNLLAVRVVDGEQIAITGVFRSNRVGLEIQSSREIDVIESVLAQNDIGVRLIDTETQIRSSNITENSIGIDIHSDQPILLRENNITHNEIGVQIVRGTANLGRSPDQPGLNNLFSNAIWNLALEAGISAPLFAEGNYWGGLTLAEIDETIRDDDEAAGLPSVQFDPTLSWLAQTNLKVEIVNVEPVKRLGWIDGIGYTPQSPAEGLIDGSTIKTKWARRGEEIDGRKLDEHIVRDDNGVEGSITIVSAQGGGNWTNCLYADHDIHLRAVNLGIRPAESFTVELYLSDDMKQEPATDFQVASLSLPIQQLGTGGERYFDFRLFSLPDLAIDGISGEFYFWPRVVFVDTGESLNLPGKWMTIYEELADLVGTINEISESAMPGEEIHVRYSIKNYGLKQKGSQTLRFYLSKASAHFLPPQPDYPLLREIELPKLEGEWESKLTVPADVPVGEYYLWMMVDADNDIIECSSDNNPATYLANPIRIGDFDEVDEPRPVFPHDKRPMVLGALKTMLLQNYPNPFNPETWIPFTLDRAANVEISLYDAKGDLVRMLELGHREAGIYHSKVQAGYWDGNNDVGEPVSSGGYFYELRAGDETFVRKAMLLK